MKAKILHIFPLLLSCVICQTFNWTKPESLNKGLPSSIQIFTLNQTNSPFGTSLTGGYARFNMNDSNLQFIVKDTNGDALGYFPKTPEQYAEVEENIVYSVLNGGFFNMQLNTSASFLAQKKKIKSKNEINSDANHHPTVGAFGYTITGQFQSEYIYSYGSNFTTYKFRTANPYPGPAPSQSIGQKWQVIEGIGAGPLLVKNHQVIPGNPENFGESSMIKARHPRSAICIDVLNRLYFVAIDGRYDHSAGLEMGELAILMKSLGCRHAMNLDGGGSTNLYANKVTINRPSDATGPRPVVSAVLLRDKYKKKSLNLLTE